MVELLEEVTLVEVAVVQLRLEEMDQVLHLVQQQAEMVVPEHLIQF